MHMDINNPMDKMIKLLYDDFIEIDEYDCWIWTGPYKCRGKNLRPAAGTLGARGVIFELEKGHGPIFFSNLRAACKNKQCVSPYHTNEHVLMLQDTRAKRARLARKSLGLDGYSEPKGYRVLKDGRIRAKAIIIPNPYPTEL